MNRNPPMNVLYEIATDLYQYCLWRPSPGLLHVKAHGIPTLDQAMDGLRWLLEAVRNADCPQYIIFESEVIAPPQLARHLPELEVTSVLAEKLIALIVVTSQPRYASTAHYFQGKGLPIAFAYSVEEAQAMIAQKVDTHTDAA